LACEVTNAGDVIALPVGGKNTEKSRLPATWFAISLNGTPIAGDKKVIEKDAQGRLSPWPKRYSRGRLDGLGACPRLDWKVDADRWRPVTRQSQLNLPAYVARAEMRIIDLGSVGGAAHRLRSCPLT